MREGYKNTILGDIPESWDLIKLGEILNVNTGSKNAQDSIVDGEYPFFTRSVNTQRIDEYSYDTEALLIAGEGIFKVKYYTGKFDVHQRTYILTEKNENSINLIFYQNQIQSRIEKLVSTSVGSTVQSLRKPIIQSLDLVFPPLPEQQKIAEILSTVDKKIDAIDQRIAQTQELKKGLMQQLLTKGIVHTQFKDSPLGEIPESWEVKLLDKCAARGSGHTPNKKEKSYYNGGIKWVSLGDSKRMDNRYISKTKIEISEVGIRNSSAVLHPKGTVLLSRDAGIGKSAVMKTKMAVSQHFIVWRCDETFNNWFLYYTLQQLKPLFERIAIGSTIKTIGLGFFKKLEIAVPPIQEQQKITNILNLVDDKLDVLLEKRTSFQQLKKGLMQQLLTGRMRVLKNL